MAVSAIRGALSIAVSGLALIAAGAQAQSAPAKDQQSSDEVSSPDIVVTGTVAALESAETTKRESNVLVDGISADDIGALPDVSIADSIVRIPGVSANSAILGFDQASIRGLGPDLTLVEYNGRILPTVSAIDRRVSLAGLPTEGIGAAIVQKTPDAATIEGGVAGIINILSIRPLETRRRGLSLVARGIFTDTTGDVGGVYGIDKRGFRAEAGYVQKLAPNLGVALSYAYLQQSNVSPQTYLEAWRNALPTTGTGAATRPNPRYDLNGDGVPELYAGTVSSSMDYVNQRRHAVIGMVQWDPTPSVRVSVDGMYIASKIELGPTRFLANGAAQGSTTRPTSYFIQDGNVVTQFQGDVSSYRINFNRFGRQQRNYEGGLNVKFDDGGPVKFVVDAVWARATHRIPTLTAGVENDAATIAGQVIPVGYDVRDPSNPKLNFVPLGADDYALAQITYANPFNEDTIKALRADFTIDADGGIFDSIQFGMKVDGRSKNYYPNGSSLTWNTRSTRPDLDGSFLETTTNPLAKLAEYTGGVSAASFPVFDLDKLATLANQPGSTLDTQALSNLTGQSFVDETSYALYYQANIDAGPLTGNVGLRWIATDQSVSGYVGSTVANAQLRTIKHDYDYLLPALNLKYAITPKLAIRFGANKVLSRPVYQNLRIGASVDLTTVPESGTLTVNRGNPDLKPFTAKGIDLSAEWYPNRATSFAIQGYYKWVNGFYKAASILEPFTYNNGQTILATVNSMINDPEVRTFRGIEVLARRNFDFLPGPLRFFGAQANYTHNLTDAVATIQGINVVPNNFNRDLFNGQLYYSRPAVDLRLAYRWASPSPAVLSGNFRKMPGIGQFDLSGSVALYKGLRLSGYIRNLTKQHDFEYFPFSQSQINNSVLFRRDVYTGRSLTIGLRAAL